MSKGAITVGNLKACLAKFDPDTVVIVRSQYDDALFVYDWAYLTDVRTEEVEFSTEFDGAQIDNPVTRTYVALES